MRRLIFPVFVGALAMTGGVYFGLFSCGGYVWHRQLFDVLFAAAILGTVVVPPRAIGTWLRRAAFIGSALVLFVLIQAAASTFYPAPPSSWGEFLKSFSLGLLHGPC